ncbi:hypothetical protein BBK82_03675 [Lentzea guizhouensis]|uniref:Uncharacterized protein n=1 Tax=Lentzea guizhouensis TaxID=1586287 RepID=A0A1B2HCB2_9PSEU|nr:hypothetical protein [Lentzea guizhouensis]ANZ35316.1 hypothetical protein BBK82_03675 [Lentzea guizhouensis]
MTTPKELAIARCGERRPDVTTTVRRERCEKSDLWPEECAHCRGLQLDVGDMAEIEVVRRWRAPRTGVCPTCEHQYEEGDVLMRTVDDETVCERCRA